MLKVDQLEYLHCNSVVMWPEYHKIQKPIKINWMEGVREKSTSSASRYVCARRVWNVWCWSDMTNHSNTHNPTKSYISACVMCECDAVMSVMWLLTRRDVWRVWQRPVQRGLSFCTSESRAELWSTMWVWHHHHAGYWTGKYRAPGVNHCLGEMWNMVLYHE